MKNILYALKIIILLNGCGPILSCNTIPIVNQRILNPDNVDSNNQIMFVDTLNEYSLSDRITDNRVDFNVCKMSKIVGFCEATDIDSGRMTMK